MHIVRTSGLPFVGKPYKVVDGVPDAGARLAIDNGKGDEMNERIDVLAIMEKCTDMINPRISPEHAAWNLKLREATVAVRDLLIAADNLQSYMPQTGGWHAIEVGRLRDVLSRFDAWLPSGDAA